MSAGLNAGLKTIAGLKNKCEIKIGKRRLIPQSRTISKNNECDIKKISQFRNLAPPLIGGAIARLNAESQRMELE